MAFSEERTAAIAAAEARLASYLTAEADVLRNQSYEMPDGRKLTRADLGSITKMIDKIRDEIAGLKGAPIVRGRARRAVGNFR